MKKFLWRNILIYGHRQALFEQIIGTMTIAGVVLLWCWKVTV